MELSILRFYLILETLLGESAPVGGVDGLLGESVPVRGVDGLPGLGDIDYGPAASNASRNKVKGRMGRKKKRWREAAVLGPGARR